MKFNSQNLAFLLHVFALFVSTVKSVKINNKSFVVLKEKRCSAFSSLSTSKMTSKIECVALCQRTGGCDAVNYNRETRQCELLGGSDVCNVQTDYNSVHIYDKSANMDGKRPVFRVKNW